MSLMPQMDFEVLTDLMQLLADMLVLEEAKLLLAVLKESIYTNRQMADAI